MIRKTKRMLHLERRLGQPLERALPRLVNEYGARETAAELGISASTLSYWMEKFQLRVTRVAVSPGEQIVIHDPEPRHRRPALSRR